MSNEINEINNVTDPFDEALEDNYKSVFIDISTGKLFTTSILPHFVSEMQGAVKKHPQKTDRHITESIDGYVPVVV